MRLLQWFCVVLISLAAPLSHGQASDCPQGETAHLDSKGTTWCMDKEGRSYALEVKPTSPAVATPNATAKSDNASARQSARQDPTSVWESRIGSPWARGPITVLNECEGDKCNGTWTIHSNRGRAEWDGGPNAILVIEEITPKSITFRRLDFKGDTPSLTAIYKGAIVGGKISGTVTWKYKGLGWRNDEASGKWSATLQSGSLNDLKADVPEPQDINSTFGPLVDSVGSQVLSRNADGVSTGVKASIIAMQYDAFYIKVSNHSKAPLTAFSAFIVSGGQSYRHYYKCTDAHHYFAMPGFAIVENMGQNAIYKSRLLAAIFADGSTFGDPDELTILMTKIEESLNSLQ